MEWRNYYYSLQLQQKSPQMLEPEFEFEEPWLDRRLKQLQYQCLLESLEVQQLQLELEFEEPWLGTKSLPEELALAQLSVHL